MHIIYNTNHNHNKDQREEVQVGFEDQEGAMHGIM